MSSFEIVINCITALGALATAGIFIYMIRGQKGAQKQIDSLSQMVAWEIWVVLSDNARKQTPPLRPVGSNLPQTDFTCRTATFGIPVSSVPSYNNTEAE